MFEKKLWLGPLCRTFNGRSLKRNNFKFYIFHFALEMPEEQKQQFKVTIDNITIDVPAGTTILNAARKIGGEVAPPAMCYYSKLEGSGGKCRT